MAGAFIIQPAFTGGEVSQDIAARVDLDKYQRSLTAAKNTLDKALRRRL